MVHFHYFGMFLFPWLGCQGSTVHQNGELKQWALGKDPLKDRQAGFSKWLEENGRWALCMGTPMPLGEREWQVWSPRLFSYGGFSWVTVTLEGSVFCVIKKGLPTSHFIPLSTLPSFNPLIQVVFIDCLPDVWLALIARVKQVSPILIDWLYYLCISKFFNFSAPRFLYLSVRNVHTL